MSLPPGPRLPPSVQALLWARRPLQLLDSCRRRFGDTFTLRVRNGGTWVVVADPQEIRKIFRTDHEDLGVGLANSVLGPLLGPGSVMLLEEPDHLRRRRIMLPPFHGARMAAYGQTIEKLTLSVVREWPRDRAFALWPSMQRITLESIMHVVFGEDLSRPRMVRLRDALRELTDWMNDPRRLTLLAVAGPSWLAGRSDYRTMMAPVESLVLDEVRALRELEEAPGESIAAMLSSETYEDGGLMSDADLRDELVTLLTDGPTSALLVWSLGCVLRSPECLVRLTDELEQEDSQRYLNAVIRETMRLCPAAPLLMRRLKVDMSLGGFQIPAGTTVAPCVHLVHHNEALYPDHKRFYPERFLQEGAEGAMWIPFGGGVRRCLAASYAEMLMREVLTTILREVELEAVGDSPERPLKSAITFVPHLHGLVRIRSGEDDAPSQPDGEASLSRRRREAARL